jgi:hypothetical protein
MVRAEVANRKVGTAIFVLGALFLVLKHQPSLQEITFTNKVTKHKVQSSILPLKLLPDKPDQLRNLFRL